MTTNLTLAVGARERRARILAAFARLLLGCKHTFDLSETPEATTVMQARQELYVEALQPYPLQVIELAAIRCAQAESGWFPATGEWCAACRDVLRERDEEARRREQAQEIAARRAEAAEQMAWVSANSPQGREFFASMRKILARKVMR